MTETTNYSMALGEAVDRWREQAGGRFGNAYAWYRQQAQRNRAVSFGETRQLVEGATNSVPVLKIGNRWMADPERVEAAFAEHRAAIAEKDFIAAEYDAHRLVVGPGKSVRTRGGGYQVAELFHARWNDVYGPDRNDRFWRYNQCWKSATTEHNKPECHACRDWNGCNNDCTLSGVRCGDCGTCMAL